ncbi:helix-turn-helix transcriptional regulator [Bacillus salipaludis]|uniref:helix-turn-helix domain-containing protein n=1 Tax=Bacillus salipaludis TaxID=2547811 RepID=UPI002E1A67F4|nr:helix-turn-helix transcriptional regulator [Bacillus salipaludis]
MLGSQIQKLRQEKKLTLSQLAEKTDISKSYLSHIERNIQTNPTIEVLVKIAAALDVDLHTLLYPNKDISESTNTKRVHVTNWSEIIKAALEAGLINKADLKEISVAIENEKLGSRKN